MRVRETERYATNAEMPLFSGKRMKPFIMNLGKTVNRKPAIFALLSFFTGPA